ncbi:AP-4 complex subunit beta-1 [Perkinsus olseni]|uniref:AP complex subunit beta n=1 Tax=Perkinsus olseni TaxID=32597 RepID=A0A7J6RCU2_PEROL|nr:AP-4 complex subunit beta-1 [Perkinsus olseni]
MATVPPPPPPPPPPQSAQYFDKRGEINELRQLLQSVQNDKDQEKKREAIKKRGSLSNGYRNSFITDQVIAFMTLGIDVSRLFPEMVMASYTNDLVQKKMIYLYLVNYAASNPSLAVLAINTLQKDCQDTDPSIRGLALRSLCGLQLSNMMEYLEPAVKKGLADPNGYVRKAAVVGALKMFHLDPQHVRENTDIVQDLYHIVSGSDHDPDVIYDAVVALNEILADIGGIELTQEIVDNLLNNIYRFSEWGADAIIKIIAKKYRPNTEEEMFDVFNILDPLLKQNSPSVIMAASTLYIEWASAVADATGNSELLQQVMERLKPTLLTLLGAISTGGHEQAYVILSHIIVLVVHQQKAGGAPLFTGNNYKNFYCRYNEPSYIKYLKLQLLTLLACQAAKTDSTCVNDILGEFRETITNDPDSEVSREAVRSIGAVGLACPGAVPGIFDILLDHLTCSDTPRNKGVASEAVVVLKQLLRSGVANGREHTIELITSPEVLEKCLKNVSGDPLGKAAVVWILGEYGESIPMAPYILEDIINDLMDSDAGALSPGANGLEGAEFGLDESAAAAGAAAPAPTISKDDDEVIKASDDTGALELLTACTKLFFARPPEMQKILGLAFNYAVTSPAASPDVRDRALMYYRLLQRSVQEAHDIVLVGDEATANASADTYDVKIDDRIFEEEFDTLSVIYRMTSSKFVPVMEPLYQGTARSPMEYQDETEQPPPPPPPAAEASPSQSDTVESTDLLGDD